MLYFGYPGGLNMEIALRCMECIFYINHSNIFSIHICAKLKHSWKHFKPHLKNMKQNQVGFRRLLTILQFSNSILLYDQPWDQIQLHLHTTLILTYPIYVLCSKEVWFMSTQLSWAEQCRGDKKETDYAVFQKPV